VSGARGIPATALVQASSRSWAGGPDDCVNLVDGVPAVVHTLGVLAAALPDVPRVVVAPAFERDGPLARLLARHQVRGVPVLAAHDASPLKRMVDATAALDPAAWALRVDGVSMFVDPRTIREMVDAVRDRSLDCYKTPDDYPALLAVDLYRVGALREAVARLPVEDAEHVHPKFFMLRAPGFRTAHHPPVVHYTDRELARFRERAVQLYTRAHGGGDAAHAVAAGDQLGFHYTRACTRIDPASTVLDVACGAGFGSARLAAHAARVIAGDLDPEVVSAARRRYQRANLEFRRMDARATELPDDAVDCVTSFETIEHTEAGPYLAELDRVLRPGGLLFLSTPQSCHGRMPINPWHAVEYGRDELRALVEPRFEILEFTGLKQGCIALAGDPIGQNSYLVARSRKEGRT
jgi:2-polyprenyl-3-methyl-5-hydroxy-6-metoxy-1,4-benzoquinol methylase